MSINISFSPEQFKQSRRRSHSRHIKDHACFQPEAHHSKTHRENIMVFRFWSAHRHFTIFRVILISLLLYVMEILVSFWRLNSFGFSISRLVIWWRSSNWNLPWPIIFKRNKIKEKIFLCWAVLFIIPNFFKMPSNMVFF